MKANQPWKKLGTPAALFAGFALGFGLRGPVLNAPQAGSFNQEETETEDVVPAGVKKPPAKTSPPKPEQKTTAWDEKTIRSLGLPEIKLRLNQLSSWPPGPQTDRVERWLVKRWATLEPREACQYAYAAVLQGAETSLLEEPLRVWAETSPTMASSWAGSLGSPSIRDFAVRLVFGIWAGEDSSAAAAAAAKLRSAAARTAATMAVAPPRPGKIFLQRCSGPGDSPDPNGKKPWKKSWASGRDETPPLLPRG